MPRLLPGSVLSGLVLKGYIILLLKVYMRILGMDLIIRLRINDLLFVFGILAMVIGSAKALQQHMVKRVIAYSSIAQIGYIFMESAWEPVQGWQPQSCT